MSLNLGQDEVHLPKRMQQPMPSKQEYTALELTGTGSASSTGISLTSMHLIQQISVQH